MTTNESAPEATAGERVLGQIGEHVEPGPCRECGKSASACGRSHEFCCASCSQSRFRTHDPATPGAEATAGEGCCAHGVLLTDLACQRCGGDPFCAACDADRCKDCATDGGCPCCRVSNLALGSAISDALACPGLHVPAAPRPSEADMEHDEWCICSTEFRAKHGDAHTRICSQQWGDLTRLLAARDAEHERQVTALRKDRDAAVSAWQSACSRADLWIDRAEAAERDRDEARRDLADLRAGVEATAALLHASGWNQGPVAARDLRALLPRDDAAGAGGGA